MIQIIDVSKTFRIWEDRSRSIKETAINLLKGKKRSFREIWALRDLNFKVSEGESIAFIGENGSGKSTLLKLLYGIYFPDKGRIVTEGKVSALLELGVGFHPELTGEENIYLNGSMLGFNRKEMKKRFEEIVSFSEIGDFIYSPIRTYSSGMSMRLGFSVAMCVDPDILLIDEVLAVGDEAFQKKCLKRLEQLKSTGKTIVIVSHALEMVKKFCERAVLLHEGRIMVDGKPEEAIEQYLNLLSLGRGLEVTRKRGESERSVRKEMGPVEPATPEVSKAFEVSPREDTQRNSPEEEGEIEFDQERVRIIEIEDSHFFAGELFRKSFGHSPPVWPSNFVAVYEDSKDPLTFHVIGFIHLHRMGEMGLVGGLCVDSPWKGKGLGKKLLRSVEDQSETLDAFFIYTSDARIPAECGYEALPYPHLMVKWTKSLSSRSKKKLINAALAIGPF